ncbi:hypothetical protein FA10DRAFT_280205 [Acaromyces ingoldii]|uniref:Uncharacterized protein n=1 Tax=Acaromyces ingoldii TaxID=215250 RepID=A0A316YIS1_9BASI|nr:hypothetical protein FA10DRAFT_280205 [Acaromyces ingoldii]PWN89082.1 hypothetical protein FA10DRAFT_280205 [Acaromyces ingoldii]
MSEQPEETHEGATPLQILFHAIQSDNAELLQSVLDGSTPPSLVDARNGAGDTVVLASLRAQSLEALQLLLDEEVDVDEGNRARDGDRPLHVAVQIKEVESRDWCVEQLLEAGSDPRLTNTEGLKPVELLPPAPRNNEQETDEYETTRRLLRNAEAVSGLSKADVVDEDDESEGGPPSDEE